MKIFNVAQIQKNINLTKDLEEIMHYQKVAFMDFSSDLYDVPPPMQFIFSDQGSDCHIKGGHR